MRQSLSYNLRIFKPDLPSGIDLRGRSTKKKAHTSQKSTLNPWSIQQSTLNTEMLYNLT